jgi:hypothetical protein
VLRVDRSQRGQTGPGDPLAVTQVGPRPRHAGGRRALDAAVSHGERRDSSTMDHLRQGWAHSIGRTVPHPIEAVAWLVAAYSVDGDDCGGRWSTLVGGNGARA